jgi:hypothetical protein
LGIVLLSTLVMCLLIIGGTILVGHLVYYHTSNPIAAYIAATTTLAYPAYYNYAAAGLRPKNFTVFFGLLGIYLYLVDDRWTLGGFSAGLAAGYWQFGVIFPVLAVVTAYTTGKKEFNSVVIGGLGATLLVVAPVYLSSPVAFSSMLIEVIGTSIWVTEPFQPGLRLRKFLRFSTLNAALPVIGLGLFGSALTIIKENTKWIAAGTGWFLLQVFRLDLDGNSDLILIFIFAALGIGILIDAVDEEVVPLYLVLGVVATGFVISLITVQTPVNSALLPGSLDALLWEQEVTERCHVRMSGTEEGFIQIVGESVDTEECRYQIRRLFED